MDKNTQQPVAWRVTHIDDQDEQYIAACDRRRVAHFQAAPAVWEMTPLYIAPPAPPVPRGVLMAALVEYHGKVSKFLKGEGGPADVNEVADRYASQVQPEPVNQQLLAALKLAESVYRKNVVVEGEPSSVLSAMQAAIAVAEAAQQVSVTEPSEAMIDAIQQVRLIDWCCDKDGNPTTVSECSARAIAEAVIAAGQKVGAA